MTKELSPSCLLQKSLTERSNRDHKRKRREKTKTIKFNEKYSVIREKSYKNMSVSALGNSLSWWYHAVNDLTIEKWPIMTNQILIKSTYGIRIVLYGLILTLNCLLLTLKWPEMNSDKLGKGPRHNGISKLEPSEFQIGDDDETYMIGAEVGYVMGLEKVISECP